MFKKMADNWQALALIATILGAGGTGAFAYSDLLQQVSSNTNYRLIQEFERLDLIRKKRPLSQIEWLKWCSAGRELKVFVQCPARRR